MSKTWILRNIIYVGNKGRDIFGKLPILEEKKVPTG